MGRGAGVVAGVVPQGGADGQGADRGVGGRHPQLVPPRPLGPAHLSRDHGDPLEEVDHGVVVVPAVQGRMVSVRMSEPMDGQNGITRSGSLGANVNCTSYN